MVSRVHWDMALIVTTGSGASEARQPVLAAGIVGL